MISGVYTDSKGVYDALTADEKLEIILDAADQVKAENPQVISLTGKSLVADYFALFSGRSNVQMRAIADKILEVMESKGVRQLQNEGYPNTEWIVIDYGDVVVHIMSPEQRDRYQIEALWQKMPGMYSGQDASTN